MSRTAWESPAAWPEGIVARYLTVAGATVDITGGWPKHWRCTACPKTSVGQYTNPFGTPFSDDKIHEQAQQHAESCRALPRPEGA
ncbi:hypothetical protein ACFY97_18725 [Streptomyces klenkii]|uniref:hypothetical protein n=1 Tax=Streptomyces klenkii TaxID=1420899 RepID=UPI0036E64C66